MVAEATARAVNDMTARWARAAVGERDAVLTAAGVWPLLALLAGPATGPARKELAEALGTDAEHAVREGRELLAALTAADGVDAAVGLWARRTLTLHPEWLAALPPAAHGELTEDPTVDQAALDAWARQHTDGLIERMPPGSPLTPCWSWPVRCWCVRPGRSRSTSSPPGRPKGRGRGGRCGSSAVPGRMWSRHGCTAHRPVR